MNWLPFALDLVLGAILGTLLSFLLPGVYRQLRDRRISRRRERRKALLENPDRIYSWLVDYYQRNDRERDLFDCKIGAYERKIAFLTKSDWQRAFRLPSDHNVLLEYAESDDAEFVTDEALLKRRQKLGQRLFNLPALYLDRIQQADGALRLCVKRCDYFQIATSMFKLEEETFRAVQRGSFRRTPLRDEYIPSVDRAEQLAVKPFAIGCAFVFALGTGEGYEILIHTRSHTTVTFGGLKATTPNFGLAPVTGGAKRLRLFDDAENGIPDASRINLLYYNFVKEYLEELFNYEELIDQMRERRADPLWFFGLPEAREVTQLINADALTIDYLGFGFDALNGNAVIALLGILDDVKFARALKRRLVINWEFAGEQGLLNIEAVDVRSPLLEQWLRENRYHTGAAFAIAKALSRLEQHVGEESLI